MEFIIMGRNKDSLIIIRASTYNKAPVPEIMSAITADEKDRGMRSLLIQYTPIVMIRVAAIYLIFFTEFQFHYSNVCPAEYDLNNKNSHL